MKTNLVTALFLAFVSSSVSFAQVENSNTSSFESDTVSSGLKISFLLPVLNAKYKINSKSSEGQVVSAPWSESLDTLGLSLGVSNIPMHSIGFLGQLSFLQIDGKADSENTDLIRLEANAAYGANEETILKGGLNYSNFTSSNVKDYIGGLGLQIGVGYQFSKHLGLDLNYTIMRFIFNRTESPALDAELELSGLELGLTASF